MIVEMPFELDAGRLEATGEALVIRGDLQLLEGDDKLPAVVICHGYKGFKDWGHFPYVGRRLAEAGFAAVAINFSTNGVGEAPLEFTELGKFARSTYRQDQRDLGRALDAITSGRLPHAERLDPRRIGLFGHSRGGGTVILRTSGDPRIKAVVCTEPVASWELSEVEVREWRERGHREVLNARTGQLMREEVSVLEDYEAHKDQLDIVGAMSRIKVPGLILRGDSDWAKASGEFLMSVAPSSVREHVLPGANHTFGAVHPFQGTTDDLEEAIKAACACFTEALFYPTENAADGLRATARFLR